MKFCIQCGASAQQRVPAGDTHLRWVCSVCEHIHYDNPRIIAGCLVSQGDRVLLCRRAIAPRLGFWTLPAGFMENHETLAEAACRETREEACALAEDATLYAVYDLPHISQIYVFFRATLGDGGYASGDESLEVALFDETQIPWGELAFPTVARTLECFFSDRRSSSFPIRHERMGPMGTDADDV